MAKDERWHSRTWMAVGGVHVRTADSGHLNVDDHFACCGAWLESLAVREILSALPDERFHAESRPEGVTVTFAVNPRSSQSARDEDRLARDVAGCVTTEEGDCGADLVARLSAAERLTRNRLFEELASRLAGDHR
jgi:hypothetical protein